MFRFGGRVVLVYLTPKHVPCESFPTPKNWAVFRFEKTLVLYFGRLMFCLLGTKRRREDEADLFSGWRGVIPPLT